MENKNRTALALTAVAMMVVVALIGFVAVGDDVSGDDANQINIGTEEQLRAFAEAVNKGDTYEGKTVYLTNNITLTKEWTPIGNGQRSGNGFTGSSFKGIFEGGHNIISHLRFADAGNADAIGLFGVVAGGEIRNVIVTDVYVYDLNTTGNDGKVIETGVQNAGCIAGILCNGGKISGCEARSSGSSDKIEVAEGAGGIVGRILMTGTVDNCINSIPIKATVKNNGGIVGAAYYKNEGMTISNCTNNAIINGNYGVGGIVGLSTATIKGCLNKGAVSGTSDCIGGIVGEQQNQGTVTGCTNEANVENTGGGQGIGGIVGWVRYSGDSKYYSVKETITVSDCVSTGNVTTKGTHCGGIIGCVFHSINVSGCEASGSVKGNHFIGGLIGGMQTTDTNHSSKDGCGLKIVDCAVSCTVSANEGVTPTNIATVISHYSSTDSATKCECTLRNGSLWVVYDVVDNGTGAKSSGLEAIYSAVTTYKDGKIAGYLTLSEAVTNADAGSTITLHGNITLSKTVEVSKDLTIDLNGYDITSEDTRAIHVKTGTLTLTGKGTIQVTGSINKDSSVIRVGDSGNAVSLIVGKDVYILTKVCYGISAFGTNTSINVTINGDVTVETDREAFANNGLAKYTATEVVIGSDAILSSSGRNAVYFPGKGTLTINGTLSGVGGIEVKSGTITISKDAVIMATAKELIHVKNTNDPSSLGYAIAVIDDKEYVGGTIVNIDGEATIIGAIGILADDLVDTSKQGKIIITGELVIDDIVKTVDVSRFDISEGSVVMSYKGSLILVVLEDGKDVETQIIGSNGVVSLANEATLTLDVNDAGGFNAVLEGDATIKDNFTLGAKDELTIADGGELSIVKDKILKLNEGAIITGKIAGQGSNAVVVDGLKAGSDGIKFTSGSLWIDGVIVSEGATPGITVKIVSGTEVYISGQLDKGVTMQVDAGTTVTIGEGTKFVSSGKITNNGTIVNAGELTNTGSIENKSSIVNAGSIVTSSGTVTNTGTLKMTDSSTVSGSVVNNGIVADERASGSTAVSIDTKSTGAVVTKTNADSYGKDVKVIVEDPKTTPVSEGTITSTSNSYGFVSAVTTTGKLEIVLNDGYKTYTLTIPSGTTIAMGTVVSVEYLDSTSDTTKYEITTPGITKFSVKLPVQTGFKSAKVYCNDSTEGISNVKYNASSGYVTFDAGHNSTFTIVLSYAEPSSDTSSDVFDKNTAFIGAIVILVVAILALAVVIKRE